MRTMILLSGKIMEAKKFVPLAVTEEETKKSKLCGRLLLPCTPFSLVTLTSTNRSDVESYITDCFQQGYQAKIDHFFPYLVTSHSGDKFSSALGFQSAENSTLFLEQYLKNDIEYIISALNHQYVARQHIVEIGNLTSTKLGATQMMFVFTAAALSQAGFKWMVFTATNQVRAILEKLSMPLYPLGKADPDCLLDKGDSWGDYYDNNPTVMAGYLPYAINFLNTHKVATFVLKQYKDTIINFASQVNQK